MKVRNCRTLRHSTTTSQKVAYLLITESPLSQIAAGSGLSQYTCPARRAIDCRDAAPDEW